MFEHTKDGFKSSMTGRLYQSLDQLNYAEPKCHTCDTRTTRNTHDQPEGFLRHNSKLWQEMMPSGIWLCPACKKAQLMREGKELKRREKAGENVDRFKKEHVDEVQLSIGG